MEVIDLSTNVDSSCAIQDPSTSTRKRINTAKSLHAYTDASVDCTYARNTKIIVEPGYIDDYEPALYDEDELKEVSLVLLSI